jgi:phenylpropionate dioxygenase-like ring-hydroxylating dioxygenase large terminal subunit
MATASDPRTLPFAWYTDEEQLRRERRRIFARSWQYGGRADQVTEPGSFLTTDAGGIPLLVTRSSDGDLRAFLNVCRHRGAILTEGCGRRETIQCHYHAWTYGLDGSLRAAPRSDREAEFDKEVLSLLPATVGVWGPFLFVNPDPEAEPLADWLGDLPAILARDLDLDEITFHSRVEFGSNANWKVVTENFLECYHCQVAHPGFSEVIDVSTEAYVLSTDGRLSTQHGPLRTAPAADELPRAQFHFLWPNLGINIFGGQPNISIGPISPLTPERTYRFLDYFFGREVETPWIDDLLAFDGQVGREDRVLVERVQRGIASGALEHGVVMGRSEQLIAHFQTLTAAALAL